ncbi:predicted protein [Naegleria gruberi]|uniref:Predicted protein n=1 Tax=Naegleria gruberi TaxID=5762 RepID=D2VU36_NAEGR|nr:uncharacterized protein NAEGRDRAFT_52256 [Naegleria gruberi]EFC39621.1 predicted protein [Naegleria gruberi]|eukprot:XP_002672365.1 predicted protein [Naegleria gruberi strain NEG-M]
MASSSSGGEDHHNMFLSLQQIDEDKTNHASDKTMNVVSTSTNSTNNNEPTVIEYSPISCDGCRVNHRRCDRTKPSCHGCSLRGMTCKYSTNYKRRAKPVINNSIKHEDVTILDYYFSGFKIMERKELEQFLISHYKSNNSSSYNKEMNEMAALYYSIKASCECQMGNIEKSEKSAKQAKDYLSKVFDSHSSTRVAITYLNMCFYEWWFERLDVSKFYFQILLFYKQNLIVENCTTTKLLISLIQILECAIFNVEKSMDLYPLSFERFLEILPDTFTYFMDDCKDEYNDCYQILKHPHLIDSSNCMELNTFVQTLISECKNYEDETFGKSDTITMYYEIIKNGTTLGILSKYATVTPMVEFTLDRCAKSIVKLISNPNVIILPIEILTHVSVAAEYHYKKTQQQQPSGIVFPKDSRVSNYVEMLKIELKTYKLFASRYKIVKRYYYEGIFKTIDEYLLHQSQNI